MVPFQLKLSGWGHLILYPLPFKMWGGHDPLSPWIDNHGVVMVKPMRLQAVIQKNNKWWLSLEKTEVLNNLNLKVDMTILTCIFFTNNWLTLTSEMHFVKFHPEVASCLLSRGKRKYAPLGMRLIWKYIRNSFLVNQLISHFLSYLQNYKEFKAKILDLQPEKYGLSFEIKKCTTSGWALGDENVIGIRALNEMSIHDMGKRIQYEVMTTYWLFLPM